MTEPGANRCVAEAIVDGLVAHGVEVAFGIPGVHNLALWEAVRPRADLEIVGVRHEQAAVYAADGVARHSRAPAAAFTITGPGAANAAGAFGEAAACGSPVILIASEVAKRGRSPRGSFGRVHGSPDQAAIFESLAKGVFRIRSAAEAVPMVAQGVRLASAAPQGPVYLDVPTDLLAAPVPAGAVPPVAGQSRAPAPLDELVAALHRAERPMLWAGGGAATDDAAGVVRELSRRLGAPVITTFAGRGIVTADDPGWIGLPVHEPEVLELMARADLLLGLGSAFDGMNTRNWDLPFPASFFSINLAPTHLEEEGVAHTPIVGDVASAGTALLQRLGDTPRASWADLDAVRGSARDRMDSGEREPATASILGAVDAALRRGDTVLADMAIAGYWTSGYAAPARPRQLHYPVGWGTLGFALPAAIGAGWRARREARRALVVCGDGGFMFAIGELATLREHNVPVTILVVDDGGYGMLRFDQTASGTAHFGVDLWGPDITMVARSFAIPATTVDSEDAAALRDALLAGDSESGPRLVCVSARLTPPRTTSPRWRETQVVAAR